MAELNYDDFKRRVNIQDLLIDAGYSLNRRDGLRYPSYVRMGSDGKRVRGENPFEGWGEATDRAAFARICTDLFFWSVSS